MNIGGLRFGRLGEALGARVLAAACAATTDYDHVGSTLDPARRDAMRVWSQHVDVGRGAAAFESAREAVRTWVAQRGIGAWMLPVDQPVELGATVLVVLRRGPVYVIAPDRVVVVVDEPRQYAFAYGTLPGHPERGEESFTVDWLADDTVRVTIRVDAVPATRAARLAAPAVRWMQHAALRGYIRAIAAHVARS